MNDTKNDDAVSHKTPQKTQATQNDTQGIKEILSIACELVADDYSKAVDGMSVTVRPATMDEAKATRQWKQTKKKDGYGNLPWEKAVNKCKYSPKKFAFSISDQADNLLALVSGEIDLDGSKIIMRQLERDGSKESFEGRAIPLASRLMYQLAEMFDFNEIRIMEPANGLIERYKEYFDDAVEEPTQRPPYIKVPVYKLAD